MLPALTSSAVAGHLCAIWPESWPLTLSKIGNHGDCQSSRQEITMVKTLRPFLGVVLVMAALFALTPATASAHPADCIPANGCVPREPGHNAGWWWSSYYKASSGTCAGDWVVTYSTTSWPSSYSSRVRLWGADWSKITWPLYSSNHVQALDGVPPGITVCLGARFTEYDIRGTKVWLA